MSFSTQFNQASFDEHYGLLTPEQVVVVRPYGDDGDDQVLAELRPRWIVMFDPNQNFIRRVEVRFPILLSRPAVAKTALHDFNDLIDLAGLQEFESRFISACVLHDVPHDQRGAQVSRGLAEREGCV